VVVDGECTAVLWSALLFYMCCLFDVCCHVALVDICFSVVNTVFCNTMLLIALFCSLRKVILKSVAKIQCVIVISISDTLCAHRSFVYVWFE